MLDTIGYVAIGLLVAVALLVAYASTRPDQFQASRRVAIAAPPEAIFPLINDLRAFTTWSPFEKKDPNMTRTFSGPSEGPGQRYDWKGNSQIGEGWLEILSATRPSQVDFGLNMVKPMTASHRVTFTLVPDTLVPDTLVPEGGNTIVTWAIAGRVPLLAKVLHLFIDVDRMCGQDFEAGLASLKAATERAPAMSAKA